MSSFLLWILFFLIILFLVKRFAIKDGRWFLDRKTNGMYDLSLYGVKETIMSSPERLFFESCRSALGPNYDIYPQVNLDKIFKINYFGDYQQIFDLFEKNKSKIC